MEGVGAGSVGKHFSGFPGLIIWQVEGAKHKPGRCRSQQAKLQKHKEDFLEMRKNELRGDLAIAAVQISKPTKTPARRICKQKAMDPKCNDPT